MDVLKINDMKMKIMLTPFDLKRFKLDVSTLDYGNHKTRERVWNMLDYIKKNYGFDHEGGKLLVQFYPAKDGGAELFVTKLTGIPESDTKTISKSNNVTLLSAECITYSFANLEDLLFAARVINGSKSITKSELYCDDGKYYLVIKERSSTKPGEMLELAPLLEFATPVSRDNALYIGEHGDKLIADEAIPTLARL